ncbi:MAG TPA: hypothetical protein VNZ43_00690 [Sphingomonadaceae bacterium]|nr:hypothetical protein [Sphingomonadaceae bacterium]
MIEAESCGAVSADAEAGRCWRDDLRLFAFLWAAGFLFVSALLA